MNNKNKILAVVVLYNEHLLQTETYTSFIRAIKYVPMAWCVQLYVYDNSSMQNSNNEKYAIKYTHNPDNPGLSVAYNSAANYAMQNGFGWLLLLDQDTTLPVDFFEITISDIENHGQESLFAPTIKSQNNLLISPFRMIGKIGVRLNRNIYYSLNIRKYAVINSGIVVSVSAFIAVGGYNEAVKLDFSDTEFICRFAVKYDSIFITKATCIQQLSTFHTNIIKLKKRFAIFCQGAKACSKNDLYDRISYVYVVVKRTLSLVMQTRSFEFVKIFWNNYVVR